MSASSTSSAAITYTVSSGPATISGSTVTLTGTGSVVLQAAQAASTNYTAGTQTATFNVVTAPTITFSVPNHTYGDAAFTLAATSNSSGALTYSLVSGPATISGSTVTVTGTGSVVVQAAQAAAGYYTSGSLNATFTVVKASPASKLSWAVPSAITYGTALSATQLNASSTVAGSFTYSPAAGTVLNAGSAQTLSALFTPTDTTGYTTATITTTLTVNTAAQSINFSVSSPVTYSSSTISLSATGGGSGNPVTFSVASGQGSISGSGVLTLTGAGTVVIYANQLGNANYAAASQVQKSLVVNKASVILGPTSSRASSIYGDQVKLTVSCAGGGVKPTGTITIKDGSTTLASPTLAGGLVTYTSSALLVGTHTITAIYNGDANYQ